jgi:hypothetical protein
MRAEEMDVDLRDEIRADLNTATPHSPLSAFTMTDDALLTGPHETRHGP